MLNRFVLTVTLAILFQTSSICSAQNQSGQALTPDAPYHAEKQEPINHSVEFAIVVTPLYHCKVLKVWVPVPQTDFAQEIQESQFSTFPTDVKPQINREPVYGNRFAYFEFHDPQGAQIITHRFTAKVWNLDWQLNPKSVETVETWPDSFASYLQPQSLNQEQKFQQVIQQIATGSKNASIPLMNAINWIDQNLAYDHINASLKADANHAFTQRQGHCSDYHGLCATMGRALGYPTRVTYGLALYPKNSPSHCKMEAFLPPYGWVSFDLSETQKLVKKIQISKTLSDAEKAALRVAARKRMQAGFRENSWLLLTRGTDYDLVPKASKPVRVVRTAYIEADGEILPDPDPANLNKREFSWMTSHRYTADKPFKKPFKDLSTLAAD
ncbi:transglutaminase-like domain-containing protein [Gimesia fumaroli]|uniref:Transglutaminase-like superfamily protein n=1 Tax=Gimesia fumaroli TaxID=2527976 RepID=A0A518I8T3_9PLAN|nr:transglutaminase domain-containing protein [Gimesia fumaroli]QDV49515.1 Transglutaminase-like superfamily protein [Gimesia fumaroli]